MTGDKDADKSVARALAERLAVYLDREMAAGTDAALLAAACIGLGADLLRRSQSAKTAAEALSLCAEDISATPADTEPPRRMN
jgi:hypothetical protein